ncbi:MAG: aminotransferase class V-fold PLP-dependent enzyme [Streptosporangiales bacterium]
MGASWHYLDHACASPPSAGVVSAVQAAASRFGDAGDGSATSQALEWLALCDDARAHVARLLEVGCESVTLVDSTTHGLGILVGGLALEAGDNVVIPDCEFLGLTTVWRHAPARGVELRPVPSRRGTVHLDDLAARLDARTRVVALSAVQEVSGMPVDLDAVAEAAHRVGAHVVVDGIQEAGVIARRPADSGIAAYVAGGHKWLRNPYGAGFLWMSEELREQLRPTYQGYFALESPRSGWNVYLADPGRDAFDMAQLRTDGSAFEISGTPNWLGAVGLAASIDETLTTGIGHVEATARALADRMREGLAESGVEDVLTPVGSPSAIVTFSPPGGRQSRAELLDQLHSAGVHVSVRGVAGIGGIRAACHGHNTHADVDILLEVTTKLLRSSR